MNLYRSTKKQLIAEIKRLKEVEKINENLREEIKRRDRAKNKYQEMEEEIFLDAIAIGIDYATWDQFWQNQAIRTDYDRFWGERKADEIQKRILWLNSTLPYQVIQEWKNTLTNLAKGMEKGMWGVTGHLIIKDSNAQTQTNDDLNNKDANGFTDGQR